MHLRACLRILARASVCASEDFDRFLDAWLVLQRGTVLLQSTLKNHSWPS